MPSSCATSGLLLSVVVAQVDFTPMTTARAMRDRTLSLSHLNQPGTPDPSLIAINHSQHYSAHIDRRRTNRRTKLLSTDPFADPKITLPCSCSHLHPHDTTALTRSTQQYRSMTRWPAGHLEIRHPTSKFHGTLEHPSNLRAAVCLPQERRRTKSRAACAAAGAEAQGPPRPVPMRCCGTAVENNQWKPLGMTWRRRSRLRSRFLELSE